MTTGFKSSGLFHIDDLRLFVSDRDFQYYFYYDVTTHIKFEPGVIDVAPYLEGTDINEDMISNINRWASIRLTGGDKELHEIFAALRETKEKYVGMTEAEPRDSHVLLQLLKEFAQRKQFLGNTMIKVKETIATNSNELP
ncbi:MAG: hypothetical protein Q9220_004979 [cf. Caloplaca sp. 1 TL-2023]